MSGPTEAGTTLKIAYDGKKNGLKGCMETGMWFVQRPDATQPNNGKNHASHAIAGRITSCVLTPSIISVEPSSALSIEVTAAGTEYVRMICRWFLFFFESIGERDDLLWRWSMSELRQWATCEDAVNRSQKCLREEGRFVRVA